MGSKRTRDGEIKAEDGGGDVYNPVTHRTHAFLYAYQILDSHSSEAIYVEFSHNGNYLASSSKDQSAIIWEINVHRKFSLKHKLRGHKKAVVSVLWSPDDRQVITCGAGEDIRRWDVESGDCLFVYQQFGVDPLSCEWFPNGMWIIGTLLDRSLIIWNLDTTALDNWRGQRVFRYSETCLTGNGKWLVSLGDYGISLVGREDNVERLLEETENDRTNSFSVSRNTKYLLANLASENIDIWQIEDVPRYVMNYTGHKRNLFTIRSCIGGYQRDFLASGAENSRIYIWVQSRAACVNVLKGHTKAVNCVSWNPTDIHMLASAGKDGTIRIWRLDQKDPERKPPISQMKWKAEDKST